MKTHEIAVLSPLPGRAVQMLERACSVRVHHGPLLTRAEEVAEFIGAAHGALPLLANPVDHTVFDRCPNLRVVANCAVGVDNIDLEAARSHRLWVTNTPDVLTEATADLAWALVLCMTRRILEADAFLRAGRFTGWKLDLLLGTGLQDRVFGIVGFGRIGRAVGRRAAASGMRVVFADPSETEGGEYPALRLELDELVREADVISLHCPLNSSTMGLFSAERLARMRTGAYLVNTARGPLVDEGALVKLLESGHLAGAGLDVFENEPAVHPGLLGRGDVLLLPHIGSATRETRAAMAETAARNLLAVLEGETPPNAVVIPRPVD